VLDQDRIDRAAFKGQAVKTVGESFTALDTRRTKQYRYEQEQDL
jgi:hypothetical protein